MRSSRASLSRKKGCTIGLLVGSVILVQYTTSRLLQQAELVNTVTVEPRLSGCRGLPCLGFGTAGATTKAIEAALRAGYTLIDTAVLYRREGEIASAIRVSGVPRERLTIVSKAWPFNRTDRGGLVDASEGLCEPAEMAARVEEHIRALGVAHLDVLLLHWPPAPRALPSFWRALVDLKRRGLARSIGLSNVGVRHLESLEKEASAAAHPPTVVQTELAAVRSDMRIADELDALVAYAQRNRIQLMSHSSVKGLLQDDRARALARALNVSIPQLGLRYGLQRGFTMLFGSRKERHIAENLNAMRFHLTADEMAQMACWRAHESTSSGCSASSGGPSNRGGTLRETRADAAQATQDQVAHRQASSTPWSPLVASSAADLLQQHPDPLHALSQGLVPAIVLRRQLGERDRRAVIDRLLNNRAATPLWKPATRGESPLASRYGCWGRQINDHMKSSRGGAAEYARLAQREIEQLKTHGLWAPVDTLFESLRSLAGTARSVGAAVDLATNLSYSPAAYRYTQNGGYFSPHVDSMHAMGLKERLCPGPASKGADPQAATGEIYPDAFRFRTQFSALVLLQAGGAAGNRTSSALTIHELHLDDLKADCMLQAKHECFGPRRSPVTGRPTPPGVRTALPC